MMKIDLYTKSVLTVIAVSLVVIAIQKIVPDAMAEEPIQRVMICNADGKCADVRKIETTGLYGLAIDTP